MWGKCANLDKSCAQKYVLKRKTNARVAPNQFKGGRNKLGIFLTASLNGSSKKVLFLKAVAVRKKRLNGTAIKKKKNAHVTNGLSIVQMRLKTISL